MIQLLGIMGFQVVYDASRGCSKAFQGRLGSRVIHGFQVRSRRFQGVSGEFHEVTEVFHGASGGGEV